MPVPCVLLDTLPAVFMVFSKEGLGLGEGGADLGSFSLMSCTHEAHRGCL